MNLVDPYEQLEIVNERIEHLEFYIFLWEYEEEELSDLYALREKLQDQVDDDEVKPGDVRQDLLIPTRRLYIVKFIFSDPLDDWYETNLGGIGRKRIGRLLARENVEDWEWVND